MDNDPVEAPPHILARGQRQAAASAGLACRQEPAIAIVAPAVSVRTWTFAQPDRP